MGQALYRKYRSKNLSEIVGQEHITDTLRQALKSGRISHAYLFTGPRGVGKTSIARILAHELNQLEYKQEENHIDIIEIDAASNRGIDEIRDLREKVYSAPIAAKYKVYIIDEVHMLTTPAFNALLKTLEEPPEHVIFILATTEAHKLPETIISRTQRHIFRPVETSKVVDHLKQIAKAEGIKIDNEALELLAQHGGGSFRDSISLLDQAGNAGQKITRAVAEQLLGIPPDTQLDSLLEAIRTGDSQTVATQLTSLASSGYHAAAVASKLGDRLRQEVINNVCSLPIERQMQLLHDLLDVAPAYDPTAKLEIILLSATVADQAVSPKPKPTQTSPSRPAPAEPAPKEPVKIAEVSQPVSTPPNEPVPAAITSDAVLDPAVWGEILDALKSKHNTLYGVMRMAVPEFLPGLLKLRFQFAFHQKRMHEARHRAIVGDIIQGLTGHSIAIECIHDKEAMLTGPVGSTHPATETESQVTSNASLSAISNIFGGGELLES